MTTTKLLTYITVVASFLCVAAFAQDAQTTEKERADKNSIALAVHSKTRCVLIDKEVFCGPATGATSMLLASTELN
jgi:hypothetical protein